VSEIWYGDRSYIYILPESFQDTIQSIWNAFMQQHGLIKHSLFMKTTINCWKQMELKRMPLEFPMRKHLRIPLETIFLANVFARGLLNAVSKSVVEFQCKCLQTDRKSRSIELIIVLLVRRKHRLTRDSRV
jgi:hypothetical protein